MRDVVDIFGPSFPFFLPFFWLDERDFVSTRVTVIYLHNGEHEPEKITLLSDYYHKQKDFDHVSEREGPAQLALLAISFDDGSPTGTYGLCGSENSCRSSGLPSPPTYGPRKAATGQ